MSINIPDSVTFIDSNVFSNCQMLLNINIPNSVTVLNYGLFNSCSSLTSVTFNQNIVRIESSSFGDSGIQNITIPNSTTFIANGAFANCISLTSFTIGTGLSVLNLEILLSATILTNIIIPNNVTSIADSAFNSCDSLTRVIFLGTTIPSIAENNFESNTNDTAYCLSGVDTTTLTMFTNIETVHLTDSDTVTIDSINYLLDSATNTASVVGYNTPPTSFSVPTTIYLLNSSGIFSAYNVTSISFNAFANCSSLTNVTINQNIVSIGSNAFANSGIRDIIIPNSTTYIDNLAFARCSSLTSFTIGTGLTNLNTSMLLNATSLTSIIIPDNVTSIGTGVFQGCANMTSVTIGTGVTNIGDNAFYFCNSLLHITIPDSVTSIGNGTFINCESMTSITIGVGVVTIGQFTFGQCIALTNIVIPDSVTNIGNSSFAVCTSLTSVLIGSGLKNIDTYMFFMCNILQTITIPDTVTNIGDSAFQGCSNMTTVTIGTGVTIIDDNAFSECTSLTSVSFLGSTIPVIGSNNFNTNTNDTVYVLPGVHTTSLSMFTYIVELTLIIDSLSYLLDYNTNTVIVDNCVNTPNNWICSIPYSITPYNNIEFIVISIGDNAFNGLTNLLSITIPNGVNSIGNGVFQNCSNMTTSIIGTGIITIDNNAFTGCNNLTSVTFSGTTIPTIGTNNFDTNVNDTAYCVSGVTNASTLTSYFRYIQVPISQVKYLVDFSGGYSSVVGYDGSSNSLTSIFIPSSVTLSGSNINYMVRRIETNAFNGCNLMETSSIASSVTSIGDNAFSECLSLTSVSFKGKNIPTIGTNNFTILGDTAYCVVGVTNAETLTAFFTNISIPSVVGVSFF